MKQLCLFGPIDSAIAADLCAEILGATEPIELHIFSEGGCALSGFAIANAIRNAKQQVSCVVEGFAGSAATFPLCTAQEVQMSEASMLFLHLPQLGCFGNDQDLSEGVSTLRKTGDLMSGLYAAKTGRAQEEIAGWLSAPRYFTAAEALAAGLCDRVIPNRQISAKHADRILAKHPKLGVRWSRTFARKANAIGAEKKTMPEVLKTLGLKEGATEEEILKAFIAYCSTNDDEAKKLEVLSEIVAALSKGDEGDEGDEGGSGSAQEAKLQAALAEVSALRAEVEKESAPEVQAARIEAEISARIASGEWPESGQSHLEGLLKAGKKPALFPKGTFRPRASRLTAGGRPNIPNFGEDVSEKIKRDAESVRKSANEQFNKGRGK